MHKEIFSALAMILTFVAFVPYIRSIRSGKTKPHVFSWLIWGLTTFIVFLAQLAGRGGVGAWPIGISGVITFYIAFIACMQRSDLAITRVDWAFLTAALSALPFWFFTADPLWAVVILTAVDMAGFGPTFRTAWARPHDERVGFFGLFAVRNLIAIFALEHYSVTTVLFPAAVGFGCVLLVAFILYRRRIAV
jgi:hypothetical protein